MTYNGIKYRCIPNGVMVVKNTKKNITEITIPPVFNGQPVIAIGEMAFSDNTKLEKITLPSTIQTIGDFAFCDCRSLKSIVVKDDFEIITVGEGAFYNCVSLESLEFPVVITKPTTFSGCINLKCVLIGENIPRETFRYCQSLTEIHWYGCENNNIFAETDNAFEHCTNLKKLYLYFDLVKFCEQDLDKLKDVVIYCEETSTASDLAYEGYKVVVTDYNLPF